MARDEPLVAKLPREPGKRESRYVHLFSSLPQLSTLTENDGAETNASDRERIDALEKQIYALQLGLDELREKYERLSGQ